MRKNFRVVAGAAMALSAAGLALAGLAGSPAGAATSASAATVAAGPWSQAGYNAADSNANLAESTLTPATIGSASYLRSILAPPPLVDDCNPGGFSLATPLLTGGYVYVAANYTVSKYQASDGTLVWSASLQPSDVPVSIAVSGDSVVVGASECGSVSDPAGALYAFSASTGQALWRTSIDQGEPLNYVGVASGLAIVSGSSVGGGTVVGAFQIGTGRPAWLHEYAFCGDGVGPAVVVGGYVVFVSCGDAGQSSDALTAVSLTTGQSAWTEAGDWKVLAGDRSTSAGTHVFASQGGTVYDVNPATGARMYSLTGATSVLAVGSGDVYASTASGLAAYRLSNGSQAWTATGQGQVAVVAGGLIYAAVGDVLNASTGAFVTQLWAGTTPATQIVVGEGRVAAITEPRVLDLYGLAGY
jgi:PQQ-like domain